MAFDVWTESEESARGRWGGLDARPPRPRVFVVGHLPSSQPGGLPRPSARVWYLQPDPGICGDQNMRVIAAEVRRLRAPGLDLASCHAVSDSGVAELRDLPDLRSLGLPVFGAPGSGATPPEITDRSMPVVSGLSNLEYLILGQPARVTDAGLTHLGALQNLRVLNLEGVRHITDSGLAHLQGLRNLHTLRLPAQIRGPGLAHLAKLVGLKHLAEDIGVTGAAALDDKDLEPLASLRHLQSLSIIAPPVTEAGLVHIEGLAQLRELRLWIRLSERASERISRLRGLRSLDLSTFKGGTISLGPLASLPHLEELVLGELPESELAALPRFATLRRLVAGQGPQDSPNLWPVLTSLTRLTTLRIYGVQVSPADAPRLQRLHELRTLALQYSNVTDDLIPHILRLRHLEHLGLPGTRVTMNGLLQLKALGRLKSVVVPGSLGSVEMEALRRSLPGVAVTRE